MKALNINAKNGKIEVVDAKGLDDYYKYCDCDIIDVVQRTIGGKVYDIVCDDEGLLKANPIISAISSKMEPMLVGNLLIFGQANFDGEFTPLTDSDVEHIKNNAYVYVGDDNELHVLVGNCEY